MAFAGNARRGREAHRANSPFEKCVVDGVRGMCRSPRATRCRETAKVAAEKDGGTADGDTRERSTFGGGSGGDQANSWVERFARAGHESSRALCEQKCRWLSISYN